MYRPEARKQKSPLGPFDPEKIYDLHELGLFIAPDDALMIADEPGEKYRYKMKNSGHALQGKYNAEQYNDSFWLAVTKALSKIIKSRFAELDVVPMAVPLEVKNTDPHTDIFVSNDYHKKTSLVVSLPDGGEGGVWTGRLVSQQNIREGSLENFIRLFQTDERGVVLANPSQLVWNHSEAQSNHQFFCSGGRRIAKSNKIPENEDQQAHIEYILKKVLQPASADDISFVAVGFSAYSLLVALNEQWSTWKDRVASIALISSCHSSGDITNQEFLSFIQKNGVHFCASELPLKTIMQDERFGMSCVSGGHEVPECLPATCLATASEFINRVNTDFPIEFLEAEEPLPPVLIWDDNMSNVLPADLPLREAWGDFVPEDIALTPEATRNIAVGRIIR